MVKLATGAGLTTISWLLNDKFTSKHDDDFIDRINYRHTTIMLFFFSLMVAGKQFFGDPLECWTPKNYPESWEKYSDAYCFVENTYFVGFDEDSFPRSIQERESRELLYYQWVSIILLIQMILFLVPKTLWSSLNWRTGLTVHTIIESAKIVKKVPPKNGPKVWFEHRLPDTEDFITGLIKFHTLKQRIASRGIFKLKTPACFRGTYVTNLYIGFKFLNLLNVLFQIWWLNNFLGPQYTFWGWGILSDLINGVNWKNSGHFPRVTYCDIQTRQIGANIHRDTFQCVLMINMFNEKIFIFVWFWLFFLAILNALNLFIWIWQAYRKEAIRDFVKKHLNYDNIDVSSVELENFVETMIFKDIATVLRLIEYNAGDISASIIIRNIYRNFLKDEKKKAYAAQEFAVSTSI